LKEENCGGHDPNTRQHAIEERRGEERRGRERRETTNHNL
jgi:hypothetical protein